MGRLDTVSSDNETFLPRSATPLGWPELAVGLVLMAVVAFRVPPLLAPHEAALGPVLHGLLLAGLPGAAAIAGFTAAARIRVRPWSTFGLTRPSRRWTLVAVGAGLLTVPLSLLAAVAASSVLGSATGAPAGAATGGPLAVGVSVLLVAVIVPIAQELLFRGIVTTVLLRYGAVIGVVGSALIFALPQGLTPAFATALVIGLVTAELRRRSGSLWPAVVAHIVHTLVAQALVLTIAGAM